MIGLHYISQSVTVSLHLSRHWPVDRWSGLLAVEGAVLWLLSCIFSRHWPSLWPVACRRCCLVASRHGADPAQTQRLFFQLSVKQAATKTETVLYFHTMAAMLEDIIQVSAPFFNQHEMLALRWANVSRRWPNVKPASLSDVFPQLAHRASSQPVIEEWLTHEREYYLGCGAYLVSMWYFIVLWFGPRLRKLWIYIFVVNALECAYYGPLIRFTLVIVYSQLCGSISSLLYLYRT